MLGTPGLVIESNLKGRELKEKETIVGLTLEEIEAIEGQEYTDKERTELEAIYNDAMSSTGVRVGCIVKGTILKKVGAEVVVDIGFKSEGIIPISEFRDDDEVVPGQQVDVFIENLEDADGRVAVSKEKAHFHKVWADIKAAYDNGTILSGKVIRRIKGGLVVRIMGVDAFLPGSQVALRQVPNLEKFAGQELEFRVIKLNKRRRNIVVSRRQVLEEARSELKEALIRDLEEEQVRKGIVKNITDFGAFVDLGGIDGLLHITDMSWGRVRHPSQLLSIGDEIEVKVLKFDRERERISLGLKQLQPFPWEGVEERYEIDSVVTGRVASITDYGAFVELEPGVEGLIHISEMSWTKHVRHPSKILTITDEVEAIILSVNEEERKISLGLKQTQENPWNTIEERYPVGSMVKGIVRNLTNFGAFVEIEEGIDGLVHISDMSWTKRVSHPTEVLNKGCELSVIVLSIDRENHRVSLGLKQTQENPWDSMKDRFPEGTEVNGRVVQVLDRGVVVDLDNDIEGFVPLSQLGWETLTNPEDILRNDDLLPLRIIEVVPSSRRIVLSVRSYFNGRPMEELSEFREKFENRPPILVTPTETPSVERVIPDDFFGDDETGYFSHEKSDADDAVADELPITPEDDSDTPDPVVLEEETEIETPEEAPEEEGVKEEIPKTESPEETVEDETGEEKAEGE
jgi:small subunit ribosomal protein S1